MSVNLKKIEMEKNEFIRNLSQEQFDGVVTSKYKKTFLDYFNGTISDSELANKNESHRDLVSIYTHGDTDRIDTNQYLYSAIVDVAVNYYNVANSYETCMDKMNLLASYFKLVASSKILLSVLEYAIHDVFYIYNNFRDSVDYLSNKLKYISNRASTLNMILNEIKEYETNIKEIEDTSNVSFVDEILIEDDIKEEYQNTQETSESVRQKFSDLQKNCVDKKSGAKLDIMIGHLR